MVAPRWVAVGRKGRRPFADASLEGFGWRSVEGHHLQRHLLVALNRVAVGHAAPARRPRPHRAGERLLALAARLEAGAGGGRAAGFDFPDAETAFRTFFGLVARNVQVRLLLGDRLDLTGGDDRGDARRATQQFLASWAEAGPKGH